jgi:hypothetical protein
MSVPDFGQANWRKSSHSSTQTDQCVEVTSVAGWIGVRDSKNPDGSRLGFNRSGWRTFIDGVKANAFDL